MAPQRHLDDLDAWVADEVLPILGEGEEVVAATSAGDHINRYQTKLVITNTRLLTLRRRPIWGIVQNEIQLDQISRVQTKFKDAQVIVVGEDGLHQKFVLGTENGKVFSTELRKQLGSV